MWRVEHVFTKAADSLENISIESLFDLDNEKMLEFSSGGRTYRILAVASAGCGKTFVFTRVAPLKWAQNEMWTSFDLVIARKLRNREVREATDICALLGVGELGVFTSEERKSIDDFVRQQAHRVCIVLDGLDEIRLGDCSGFVQDIINGSKVRGMRLVVTSRPCVELLSLSDKKQFDRRVELVGFRQEDVDEYIGKVLRSVDEASALVAAVRRDQNLASMMATPFLAMQTCKMFHCRNGMLPKCLSDIFEMMIIQVAERNTGESYKSWNEISPVVQALILDLGEIAFSMLIERRLIFTDADMQMRAITREAKALGLLVLADSSSCDDGRLWMFSHLTLQESLAARYVAVKKATTPARVVRLVELLGPESDHLRTFWMLLTAQLDKANADCLINGVLTRHKTCDGRGAAINDDDEEWDDPHDATAEQAVFPLDMLEALIASLDDSEGRRLAEELLSDSLNGRSSVRYVENRSKYGRPDSGEQFLRVTLLTWVERCPDATYDTLADALRCMGKDVLAKSLHTPMGGGDPTPMKSPFHKEITLVSRSKLELAVLSYAERCRHHDDDRQPMSSLAAAFQSILVINGHDHPAVIRAYDVAVDAHCTSVKGVRLRKWERTTKQFPLSLLKCENITRLHIEACTYHWQQITSVVKSSHMHLQEINLAQCDLTDTCTSIPSHPVGTQPPHAEHRGRATTTDHGDRNSAMLLAWALADVRCLNTFSLATCSGIGDQGMRAICKALRLSTHLSSLFMSVRKPGLLHCIDILTDHLRSAWPDIVQLLVNFRVSSDMQEALSDHDVSAFLRAVNSHTSLQQLVIRHGPRTWCTDGYRRLLDKNSYRSSLGVRIAIIPSGDGRPMVQWCSCVHSLVCAPACV
ncbi:uncharacterized protein LOC135824702 [Sycon ciliatum]|uniref:uncharacterized protein LOC135824702 n=1 Tax=Sycon ciliatum TaxID=27933 RepID=UPI0031F65B9C